jgi:hypothetical protein
MGNLAVQARKRKKRRMSKLMGNLIGENLSRGARLIDN